MKLKCFIALMALWCIAGCGELQHGPLAGQPHGDPTNTETARPLRVALFPYMPDKKRMEELLLARWRKISDYPVEFVEFWDGYKQDPTDELDVFEYDSMDIEYFVRNGFVAPMDSSGVSGADDIADFAWRASQVDGVSYGVPHLACTYALFYRDGDQAIENASGLPVLEQLLAGEACTTVPPEPGKGLLIDLTGATDCVSLYFDALLDKTGEYRIRPSLPAVDKLDPDALTGLQTLARIAGKPQATFDDETYQQRSKWLAEGRGRAFVGYTERAGVIAPTASATWRARLLPMGATNKVNMCFVDVLSASSRLRGRRKAEASKFIAFVTSRDTVLACLMPPNPNTASQYLLPVRQSVANDRQLQAAAPLYRDLARFLDPATNPRAYRFGEESRLWMEANKRAIRAKLFP